MGSFVISLVTVKMNPFSIHLFYQHFQSKSHILKQKQQNLQGFPIPIHKKYALINISGCVLCLCLVNIIQRFVIFWSKRLTQRQLLR